MKIGTVLTLEMNPSNLMSAKKCRCKVIDINDAYLFIDIPVNIQSQKSAFLPIGTPVVITYVGNDQAVYQFYSVIEEKVELRVVAFKIPLPKNANIRRIQRRKYVRIEAAVDVAIHCPEKRFPPFTTVTKDISGGGVSLIVPSQVKLKCEQELEIWAVLRSHAGPCRYLNIDGKVINMKLDGKIQYASLEFISISQQDRQHIIYYCFQKQREIRKKELL